MKRTLCLQLYLVAVSAFSALKIDTFFEYFTPGEVVPSMFPYHIILINPEFPDKVICSGALLTTRSLVTMRTCVEGLPEVLVVIGETRWPYSTDAQNTTFTQDDIITHPLSRGGGLALLRTKEFIMKHAFFYLPDGVSLPPRDIFLKPEELIGVASFWRGNHIHYAIITFMESPPGALLMEMDPPVTPRNNGGPIVCFDEVGNWMLLGIIAAPTEKNPGPRFISFEPYYKWLLLQIQFDMGV